MTWLLDLDGVVWLADRPIPGAVDTVRRLRQRGDAVWFLTNNSSLTLGSYVEKLAGMGIDATAGDVLTSAQAAASLVAPGATALACSGPGVVEALEQRGVSTVRDGHADVVVVGWHRDFDFDRMAVASRTVRAGAQLLATNDDATYPTAEGPLPGCGAILAGVQVASGARATVAGKPNPPMVELVRSRVGERLAGATLVGDRPDTDGLMARALGIRFALVLTGVTTEADLPVTPQPDVVAPDLAALLAQ